MVVSRIRNDKLKGKTKHKDTKSDNLKVKAHKSDVGNKTKKEEASAPLSAKAKVESTFRGRLGETSKSMVPDKNIELIRGQLSREYGELLMDAMMDDDAIKKLQNIIKKRFKQYFNKSHTPEENAEFIANELVGTGVIERMIREDDTITDIEWDGNHLSVLSNDEILIIDGAELGITDKYIDRLIQKFVVVNKSEFNRNQALFNGMYGNMRMSATHVETSPYGTTFSLRVSKSRLALNETNWAGFAPMFVLEWLSTIIRARANVVIAGETGAGKTELQKFLLGFAAPTDKFYLIEDVQESHLKELYPNRRLFSTLTTPKYTITEHVKHALRNNPEWIIVAETRGSEAYEMLQAILSSHNIITTVHATDARAIPHRFMNMCLTGTAKPPIEMLEDDIYRYFDLGMHIKRTTHHGRTIRYLSEVVEYNADGTVTTVFQQVFRDGELQIRTIGSFSDGIIDRLAEKGLSIVDGDAMAVQAEKDGYIFEKRVVADEYDYDRKPVVESNKVVKYSNVVAESPDLTFDEIKDAVRFRVQQESLLPIEPDMTDDIKSNGTNGSQSLILQQLRAKNLLRGRK